MRSKLNKPEGGKEKDAGKENEKITCSQLFLLILPELLLLVIIDVCAFLPYLILFADD